MKLSHPCINVCTILRELCIDKYTMTTLEVYRLAKPHLPHLLWSYVHLFPQQSSLPPAPNHTKISLPLPNPTTVLPLAFQPDPVLNRLKLPSMTGATVGWMADKVGAPLVQRPSYMLNHRNASRSNTYRGTVVTVLMVTLPFCLRLCIIAYTLHMWG